MFQMPNYIDDGYTRDDGFIAADDEQSNGERRWESLAFSYRVATRQENIRHDAELKIALNNEFSDPKCAIKSDKLSCEFVARHLSSWDLKDRNNEDLPVSADAISLMKGFVFARLYEIIRATVTSDPKPDAKVDGTTLEDKQKN